MDQAEETDEDSESAALGEQDSEASAELEEQADAAKEAKATKSKAAKSKATISETSTNPKSAKANSSCPESTITSLTKSAIPTDTTVVESKGPGCHREDGHLLHYLQAGAVATKTVATETVACETSISSKAQSKVRNLGTT